MKRNPATDPREGDVWEHRRSSRLTYAYVYGVTSDLVRWYIVSSDDGLLGTRERTRNEWATVWCRIPNMAYSDNVLKNKDGKETCMEVEK